MSLASNTSCAKGELRQLNMCRIYFRVVYIADITDFDGTCIKQTSYDGKLDDTQHTILWPNQQRPTKGGWRIW
jgi:hypothetical protein